MASTIKSSYTKKRVADVKEFYDSMVQSLVSQRNLSKKDAADLAMTTLEEAQEFAEDNRSNAAVREEYARALDKEVDREDPLGIVRHREFQDVLDEEFDTRLEFSLADSSAARARSVAILQNFAEFGVRPEDSDAFLKNASLDAAAARSGQAGAEAYKRVQGDLRRTVGIFPKKDNQASLVIQRFSAGEGGAEDKIVSIDKFILTQVSEPSAEKYQIYQTFDQDFIFFFDRNPHIYVYAGVLINADNDFQWRNDFQQEYENNLRGTKCVENGARAILSFEDVTRQGYLLDFNMQNMSNNPMHTPFSFTFFVVKESTTYQRPKDVPPVDELAV